MNHILRYSPDAETDLDEIDEYYTDISSSVVKNFFKEFFETIAFIEQDPKLFQVRYRGIRIAPMYRYPYGIHYIHNQNSITILRVLHTKRYFK
ncbi:type II toxin-antitoxin system RelE/ParE family toxin [Mucilaginibacter conchicola]|uniref:Type II toxin-antitoxin system RelE/ParE family toxin n=1 Tax=Mucilaginibacter conchicola TaxID=2303333 RepID=A0A372NSR6_9SPHI|nr:type II toxin-antitoxin system RelE/ParE family toxin [Mucilaginibacter conchicola]